jgi:hypothetical protein
VVRRLPKRAPWLEDFTAELLAFPGRHDDQVDALTQGLAWGRSMWSQQGEVRPQGGRLNDRGCQPPMRGTQKAGPGPAAQMIRYAHSPAARSLRRCAETRPVGLLHPC